MAYPTATALVTGDGIAGSPIKDPSGVQALVDLVAGEREALRLLAISAVEEHCQQAFEPVVETRTFDGTGGRVLYLDKRLEVATALSVRGLSVGLVDVDVSEAKVVLRKVVGNYAVRAMMDDDADTRTFPHEPGVVEIAGTWGWTNCPPNVKLALRLDMEDTALADASALSDTLRLMRASGMRSLSQGNLRAALDVAPGVSAKVMRLLSPFVFVPEVGEVV